MPTVTGQVQRPTSNTPWHYATVKIGIAGSGLSGGGLIRAGYAQDQTDINGNVSFNLPANNSGEVYVWTNPDGTQRNFQVPATGGPYTLDQLVVTTTPTDQPAVTQDSLAVQLGSYQPKPTNGTATDTTYLRGDGTWATPAGGGMSFGIDANGFDTITAGSSTLGTDANGFDTLTI